MSPMPNVGFIWRGDHLSPLTPREDEWWKFHVLPFGWAIVAHPVPQGSPKETE